MELRKTLQTDIDSVMLIIKEAQNYFKENQIDQWQNNYPNEEVIKEDIECDGSYVLLKDNTIIATAAIFFDGDENYDRIYNGKWITNNKYAVMHRIAVDKNYKELGVASKIIDIIEVMCLKKEIYSIKVDTHRDNLPMQRLLIKKGFKNCGIIYLKDKSERIAFEKIVER